ncbi:MAG: hypothetical protein M3P18_04890 [Actinomycetota bacterium]|nr:hypothetical protein [Actinomycetota bacterium]
MSRTWVYVLVALGLVLFGIVGLFSIGAPFFLTGVVMLICLPWRRDRAIILPALSTVWAFTTGFLLVAPVGCTASSVARVGGPLLGGTVCRGVFFDYAGSGAYSPPLMPAFVVGLAAAGITALALRLLLHRRGRSMDRRSSSQRGTS